MSQTPVLTGQDIAEAYGAVEARLERALSATGTTNREYVVLRVLAARPFESTASLHEYLVAQRQLALSPTAVSELLAGLESRALASGTAKNDPGRAKLTPNGAELLRRIAPGHDAEVLGDEPCVMLDIGEEDADYAKRT